MARKITMNGQSRKSVAEVFEDFVLSQMAQGLSDITIATYRHHIHSISNHLDIQKPMEALTRKDLEAMIVSMRASGLAHNSISSYCRVFRTFSNWCRRAGLNIPELPNIKFIIISGYSDFEYAQKALRYHAVDYLLKPVDFETLNEVFQDVFDDMSIEVDEHTTSDDIDEWDSLEHINLIASVEQEFGVKFNMGQVNTMKNVGEMVDIILSQID